MEYDAAVDELVKIADSNNWRIGQIADSVEPKYGARTLQRLADDTGIAYSQLLDCRTVWRRYREPSGHPENSFAVYKAFAAQDDRLELVQQEWTVAKARAEVAERRHGAGPERGEDAAAHGWAVRAEADIGKALRRPADVSREDDALLVSILEMILGYLEET